jgi:hypothetical protein
MKDTSPKKSDTAPGQWPTESAAPVPAAPEGAEPAPVETPTEPSADIVTPDPAAPVEPEVPTQPAEPEAPVVEKVPTRGPTAKRVRCEHCGWTGRQAELLVDRSTEKPHYCPAPGCGRSDAIVEL